MNCTAWQPPWSPSGTSTCMGANRKLLQLAKGEPFRLRDAGELRPLNGLGGQRLRGKRLFQSVPAKDAKCHQPPVRGLSLLRKRAGQNGGKLRRRVSLCISVPKDYSSAWGGPGRQVVLLSYDTPVPLVPVFSNISPGTEFAGHVNPTHMLTEWAIPFS